MVNIHVSLNTNVKSKSSLLSKNICTDHTQECVVTKSIIQYIQQLYLHYGVCCKVQILCHVQSVYSSSILAEEQQKIYIPRIVEIHLFLCFTQIKQLPERKNLSKQLRTAEGATPIQKAHRKNYYFRLFTLFCTLANKLLLYLNSGTKSTS